jgi:Zn-finger nucleic acid-binding protein
MQDLTCPLCDAALHEAFDLDEIQPIYCPFCDRIWIVEHNQIIYQENVLPSKIYEILPELREGTIVYINNKQHHLFLEKGIVSQRNHRYYRIQLISSDKKLNGKQMWFPEHWIEPMPKNTR